MTKIIKSLEELVGLESEKCVINIVHINYDMNAITVEVLSKVSPAKYIFSCNNNNYESAQYMLRKIVKQFDLDIKYDPNYKELEEGQELPLESIMSRKEAEEFASFVTSGEFSFLGSPNSVYNKMKESADLEESKNKTRRMDVEKTVIEARESAYKILDEFNIPVKALKNLGIQIDEVSLLKFRVKELEGDFLKKDKDMDAMFECFSKEVREKDEVIRKQQARITELENKLKKPEQSIHEYLNLMSELIQKKNTQILSCNLNTPVKSKGYPDLGFIERTHSGEVIFTLSLYTDPVELKKTLKSRKNNG